MGECAWRKVPPQQNNISEEQADSKFIHYSIEQDYRSYKWIFKIYVGLRRST